MKNHLTEIAFILDRSGSMSSMVEPAISGFNRLLREQQQAPGSARFSLVLFDDQYEVPFQSVPISEVVELDTRTFVPRGGTSLLDAIGRTIDELAKRLALTPRANHPDKVIVAILTDGQENSSQRYSWQEIASRISKLTEEDQWSFLFLGANQDAIATAGRMNIDRGNTANFSMEENSYHAAKGALSRKMSAFRRRSQGATDAETVREAEAPLESLRDEEEGRDQA